MKKTLILLFILSLISCNSNESCTNLPSNFHSYDEAVKAVESSDFEIEESVNTSKSSWIRGASYYSCDGKYGYFILETDDEDYIHADMPISEWREFKNASSFGKYYTSNIKGRYRMEI